MAVVLPTITERLAEAKVALHRLQIGQAVVRVRLSDGSESEFKAAEINELRGYVGALEREAAGILGQRGAINVIF